MEKIDTMQDLEALCNRLKFGSKLEIKDIDTEAHKKYLKNVINTLKAKKITPEEDDLCTGISAYSYENGLLYIEKKAVLFPSMVYDSYVGPGKERGAHLATMNHVIDLENGLYSFQLRGKGASHSAKIQMGSAGFLHYHENPPESALRETKEELEVDGKLTLPKDMFFDIFPLEWNTYPNLALVYIIDADLSHFPKIEDIDDIIGLEVDEKEVSAKFVVSLDRLEHITFDIYEEGMFLGPQDKNIDNFLEWYSKNYD
jgi:8-oxo-dGTP pyrophosphatase MutT (NUDIX family)